MKEHVNFEMYKLTKQFYEQHPENSYPEILHNATYMVFDAGLYRICIPLRSDIRHQHRFRFHYTGRTESGKPGLDYTKMLVIDNPEYISSNPAPMDKDENEVIYEHSARIVKDATKYLRGYIDFVSGQKEISDEEFKRRYGYSTLQYCHDALGLSPTATTTAQNVKIFD